MILIGKYFFYIYTTKCCKSNFVENFIDFQNTCEERYMMVRWLTKTYMVRHAPDYLEWTCEKKTVKRKMV